MTKKIKNKGQKILEESVKEKMSLFSKTPDECLACLAPFDKKSKEHAQNWYVVVKKEDQENPVRLYCPTCWDSAQKILGDFKERLEDKFPDKLRG